MAADELRKRLNGVSGLNLRSKEPYKVKRKKLGPPDNNLDTNSHISLEWDGKRKKVVAKKEQIGLSWRDLMPFGISAPHMQSMLADVLSVPPEIYELDNLSEVISSEVWREILSEKERKFLMQFLPKETELNDVLEKLLDGDNLHFGNPCLEWGLALCSGKLHPDEIIRQERRVKADKNAYYTELKQYHDDIIIYLQKLKERWEKCKDPEKDILQKMWGRPRMDVEKGLSSLANDSALDIEQNFNDTSESCSWNADEKACSGDNYNLSVVRPNDVLRRATGKVLETEASRLSAEDVAYVGAKAWDKENTEKYSIQQIDGAKYMSYLKISKKQHQIVTNMKVSGKSIQSRSLNRVLGNLKHLDVQPYEAFVAEENKKLHAHWAQMAKDFPAAYFRWRQQQSRRWEQVAALGRDLKEKVRFLSEDQYERQSEDPLIAKAGVNSYTCNENIGMRSHGTWGQSQSAETESNHVSDIESNGLVQDSERDRSPTDSFTTRENAEMNINDTKDVAATVSGSSHGNTHPDASVGNHDLKLLDAEEKAHTALASSKNHSSLHVSSSDGSCNYKLNNMEEEAYLISGPLHDQLLLPAVSVTESHGLKVDNVNNAANVCISKPPPLTMIEKQRNEIVQDPWSVVRTGSSYFGSESGRHEYVSTVGAGLLEPRNRLLALRTGLQEDDGFKNILQGQSNDHPFSSFPNHDRGDLLNAVFKSQAVPSQPNDQEQRQMGLGLQPCADMLMDGCQLSGQFPEQKRQNEFLHENLPENLYCDGDRYLMTRPEQSRPNGIHDWNIGPIRMPLPLHTPLHNGGLLSHNWFSGDHPPLRSMWAGSSGANTMDQSHHPADQSLLSVLSQCGQLRSNGQFVSAGPPANYGVRMGGSMPRIITGLPQPLDYMGGPQDELNPVSLPNQSPGLHDPLGKPYIRSWNQ